MSTKVDLKKNLKLTKNCGSAVNICYACSMDRGSGMSDKYLKELSITLKMELGEEIDAFLNDLEHHLFAEDSKVSLSAIEERIARLHTNTRELYAAHFGKILSSLSCEEFFLKKN